jgi:signal transduction histidine kinase
MRGFADQAVIAIENARLLTELRESLDQQTATAEVLGAISSSPGDLDPVFSTMLESATRICAADTGIMYRYEDGAFPVIAMQGVAPAFGEFLRAGQLRPGPDTAFAQIIAQKKTIHQADTMEAPAYRSGDPAPRAGVALGGIRTSLFVPMLKEDELVGIIQIFRREVRPFTDKQIELVENFAAQAVIAIENARLLTELRARTDELARSVEELRALGEVSQAVNSTLDLQTVLTTIVANSVHLSHTDAGAIYAFDEGADEFALSATFGMDERLIDAIRGQRIRLATAAIGDAAARRAPVQIPDLRAEAANPVTDLILEAGFRALLVMPLLRPDRIVGALVVRRREPGEFPAATVELLQTFAAQSVVAIQNARLFGEIEEKGRELAVASQHKSQFLANMSHELRTPLNAILGYTELIIDDIYGVAPPKMREVLDRVQRNGKHLLGLINDVLDLSKIEAGQLSLQLANFSIREMLQGVYVAVEPLAAAKQLALKLDVPQGLPQGRGDERRLSQVVLNLVGNAIKFTDKGEVKISAKSVNGSFTVAVKDTGPGIDAADQQKIFEEFQQADNSSTRAKGGTGLGLAISRRIVEMHGGRLWVESEPGHGSVFAFTLPVTVERQGGTA